MPTNMNKIPLDVVDLLNEEASRFNCPDFIESDPVQFPRLFSDKRDIEIAALLASTIAWGNRTMICRNANKMFGLMDWQPYKYIIEKGFEELPPNDNIHRTFFNRNLTHYLRGLHKIYVEHGSLEDFAYQQRIFDSQFPSWELATAINRELYFANGCTDSRCLPLNLDNSALKRFNMALRWLVRDDGIVDLGIWKVISPSQLFIPLDVHVANVSRQLGLLQRASNDRKAVEELTGVLRTIDAHDPVRFDFALFSIGIEAKKAAKQP